MVKIFQNLIEFLFPPACPLCDAPVSTHGQLCADCWGAINWIDNPKCVKCGYPFPADIDLGGAPLCPVCASGQCELDWIRCACVYDDVSRSAMLPFKHAGRTKYSLFMSHAMIWALRDINVDADVVMPVPLANKRLFKRGYNQATLLARPISRALNIKMDLDSVVRTHREMMGHKNARERAENIRGVFSVVNPDAVRGKRILLVDDVMTTGATFSELRRILVRSGAAAVYGVAFCRAVRAI
ncbi:MAG: ComF family protein [Alphaproteobacteria bacterium]|nr:ComF family protein [Alphaproteobacteria bacterium]